MQNSKRGKFDVPLPSTLVYTTALTCGVLAAIALEIELSHAGYELIGLWGNLSSLRALQLRTAGPWWAIPVLAFIVGGITAAALSRLPLPWRRFRLLRWALAAALVFVLADIGHHALDPRCIARKTGVEQHHAVGIREHVRHAHESADGV